MSDGLVVDRYDYGWVAGDADPVLHLVEVKQARRVRGRRPVARASGLLGLRRAGWDVLLGQSTLYAVHRLRGYRDRVDEVDKRKYSMHWSHRWIALTALVTDLCADWRLESCGETPVPRAVAQRDARMRRTMESMGWSTLPQNPVRKSWREEFRARVGM